MVGEHLAQDLGPHAQAGSPRNSTLEKTTHGLGGYEVGFEFSSACVKHDGYRLC